MATAMPDSLLNREKVPVCKAHQPEKVFFETWVSLEGWERLMNR
jgi:hypothetical protein